MKLGYFCLNLRPGSSFSCEMVSSQRGPEREPISILVIKLGPHQFQLRFDAPTGVPLEVCEKFLPGPSWVVLSKTVILGFVIPRHGATLPK